MFLLGDVPSQLAATVGPVPAVVAVLLGRYGAVVTLLATLACDAVAIHLVYELDRRTTIALTLLHLAFATVLGLALANLFGVR